MASQWMIKKFHKKKAIRVFIYYPDRKIRLYWAIPKSDIVTVNGKAYNCDASRFYFTMHNRIPTFTYLVDRPEPLTIDDLKNSPVMSSEEYNVAVNNRVIKEIFNSADKKMDLVTAVIVGMVAVVLVVGIAGFFVYKEIESLKTSLDEIRTLLRTVTGL